MRTLLIGICLAMPAFALDIWYPRYDSRMTQNRETELAGFEQWTGQPVVMRLIEADRFDQALAAPPPNTLAQVPSPSFHAAMNAGWRPVLRFDRLLESHLFVLDQLEHIERIATPSRSSAAWSLAQRYHPNATRIEYQNHDNCLRAVMLGSVQGCMTFQVFVDRYVQAFGVQFVPQGPARIAPPIVVFASPDLAEDLVARTTNQTKIPAVGPFSYVRFLDHRDRRLFDSLKK